MPYPRTKSNSGPSVPFEYYLDPKDLERYKDMPFDEVLASLANDRKISLAGAIIKQITDTGDPTAFKLLQNSLDRIGGLLDRELPITDERYKEIIKLAASRLQL